MFKISEYYCSFTTDKNFPSILPGILLLFSLDPSAEDPLPVTVGAAGTGIEVDLGSLLGLVELDPEDEPPPESFVAFLLLADPNDTAIGDIGVLDEEDDEDWRSDGCWGLNRRKFVKFMKFMIDTCMKRFKETRDFFS